MKHNAPQRWQMAEQLQQLSQSPQAAGLIKKTSHSASPQKPYSARPPYNSGPRNPAKSSSQPWKEELPQTKFDFAGFFFLGGKKWNRFNSPPDSTIHNQP